MIGEADGIINRSLFHSVERDEQSMYYFGASDYGKLLTLA